MKKWLAVSIVLNLATGIALILVLTGFPSPDSQPALAAPPASPTQAAAPALPVAPQPLATREKKRFYWSQLESSDYRVYVANLRAIGCPKQTIRDIIVADVDNLYSSRRRDLRLAEAGSGPWSRWEETQLVSRLVGGTTSMAQSRANETVVASSGITAEAKPVAATAATEPLFMKDLDLDAAGLDDSQKKAVAELRQQYLKEIHSSNQNPSDSTATVSANGDNSAPASGNNSAPNPADSPPAIASDRNPANSGPDTPEFDGLPTPEDLEKLPGHTAWQALQNENYFKTNSQP